MMTKNSFLKNGSVAFLISFLCTIVVYWPSHDAWFVLDDYRWIKDTPFQEIVSYFIGSWGHGVAYRPLICVSFFIDNKLFGDSPSGWHYHSYVLHSVNAALLFVNARILTKRLMCPALILLFFTVSPWGHDNIAWISARTHLLGTFFFLSALYCSLLYIKSLTRYPKVTISIAYILFVFGLMTYESVVSYPFILALCFFGFVHDEGVSNKRKSVVIFNTLFILISYLILRYYLLGNSLGAVNAHNACYTEGLINNMSRLYSIFFIEFSLGRIYLILFVSAVIVYLARFRNRTVLINISYILLSAFIFYLPFSMVAGVRHRFLYMAQIPYIILVIGSLDILLKSASKIKHLNKMIYSGIIIVLLINAHTSFVLSTEWKEAGNIAKSIPEQLKKMYPAVPQGLNLVFQDIPEYYGHAGIYIVETYFRYSIERYYDHIDGHIYLAKKLFRDPNFWFLRPDKPAKYFVYEKVTGKLVEIPEDQWENKNLF